MWNVLPPRVRAFIELAAGLAGDEGWPVARAETPKPGDPVFAGVRTAVVRTNADARAGAAAAARAAGSEVVVHDRWLAGEAAPLGRLLAEAALTLAPRTAHVWGGEPSVTLGGGYPPGGRMQELALAAAEGLAAGAWADGISLLAAGTDGRDGPTDSAGAIVDRDTWAAVRAAGRNPAADLAGHRSHDALGAAGALLPAAPSGTNVADVVVALRGDDVDPGRG